MLSGEALPAHRQELSAPTLGSDQRIGVVDDGGQVSPPHGRPASPRSRIIATGASAGIGRATVELLAAEGAYVVGASRNPERLDGPRVTAVPVDLTASEGPQELVRAPLARRRRLSRSACGTPTRAAAGS
ncbi:MAG: SDR family NAD(P)-dependent oxidoreductase [Pseudonocardiaceae bacterium]